MNRPLEGVPAIVLGTGPDLPADRLGELAEHFTIGVNCLWRRTGAWRPRVSFWIDADVPAGRPAWHRECLCVCDRSAAPAKEGPWADTPLVALPASPGPLPRDWQDLDPHGLLLRPNTGVVATAWAVSLGCRPVVLLGCGCEDDGRRPEQLAAMRKALAELQHVSWRRDGQWRGVIWPWPRGVIESPVTWSTYTLSPRLARPGGAGAIERLRECYDPY